jgi:hypothetical protein
VQASQLKNGGNGSEELERCYVEHRIPGFLQNLSEERRWQEYFRRIPSRKRLASKINGLAIARKDPGLC